MLKKLAALLLIAIAIFWSYSSLLPSATNTSIEETTGFSSEKALTHLKYISKKPHYIGTKEHENVRNYILKELEALGLEVQVQEDYSLTEGWGSFTKPKNIVARYKGTDSGKSLLLMSHYDSNPFSSPGASDAGSGVVTILEGLRAYLTKNKPKNDLLILISDAEELGLNGADIFVNKHPWAKNVGLVLNFEARGSGGPSYMLIETNGGNKKLIEKFIEANPEYPVANSLAYSIYKMLPNDTDLTRFREDGNIDGFNFAFIDDHFDYHTAMDTYERMDVSSLMHQASYLMPLLSYFGNADILELKSESDLVYFNVPLFKMVSYPFTWAIPMLILAIIIFLFIVYYGIQKQNFNFNSILKGFGSFALSILINGIIGYLSWPILKSFYPEYSDILQGFPYNGHDYIIGFAFLSLAVCAVIHQKFYKPENAGSLLVAPLFFWLLLCTFLTIKLQGASFFIVPVYFTLLSLFVLARQKKPDLLLLVLLGFPGLLILSPFLKMFPVGLGLKVLIATTLLVTLLYGLMTGVFSFYRNKYFLSLISFVVAFGFFTKANNNSEFTKENPKPNSLIYFYNADEDKALWATYDKIPDSWTDKYIKETDTTSVLKTVFGSKYGTTFTKTTLASNIGVKPPNIDVKQDTIFNGLRSISVFISPQRNVNRYEVFTTTGSHIKSLKVNGVNFSIEGKPFNDQTRLINYFIANDYFLDIEFTVPVDAETHFDIYEISYDLLSNNLFKIKKRSPNMIPKPFVVNDAVIVKKSLHFAPELSTE